MSSPACGAGQYPGRTPPITSDRTGRTRLAPARGRASGALSSALTHRAWRLSPGPSVEPPGPSASVDARPLFGAALKHRASSALPHRRSSAARQREEHVPIPPEADAEAIVDSGTALRRVGDPRSAAWHRGCGPGPSPGHAASAGRPARLESSSNAPQGGRSERARCRTAARQPPNRSSAGATNATSSETNSRSSGFE